MGRITLCKVISTVVEDDVVGGVVRALPAFEFLQFLHDKLVVKKFYHAVVIQVHFC